MLTRRLIFVLKLRRIFRIPQQARKVEQGGLGGHGGTGVAEFDAVGHAHAGQKRGQHGGGETGLILIKIGPPAAARAIRVR